jgi:modulator of FtsH protease
MSPETWEAFFLGEVGASAALGGLLFVALSLNLAKLIDVPGLADRAQQTLLILLAILVFGSLMLMPNQEAMTMGWEVLGVAAATVVVGSFLCIRGLRSAEDVHRRHFIWSLFWFEVALLPCIAAGLILLSGDANGLYWLAIGICLGFVKAVFDAWVFLVEINR